jgi:RNA polymerase sigma factor (sigma-70 family)
VDRPTFEKLYREHYRLAWSAIYKVGVRRPAVIEELVHDVFIVVHQRLSELDPIHGLPRSWIYKISVYVALNHLDRAPVRSEELTEDGEPDATLAAPEDIESHAADREHLNLLLASTTPERRAVYELFEAEGFTLAETAAALEISVTTADSRLRHARDDMKAAEVRLQHHKARRRLAILPFGTGAWLHLREAVKPPAGASSRVWERMQRTIHAQGSGASQSPKRPDAEPKKWPWLERASNLGRLARRALGPSVGALGGAAAALFYAHMTQAPPKVIAVRIPVMVAPEAELNMIVPEASPEEASAALPAPGGSGEPSKAANPAALLALRKAQAAYMIGDAPGALDALGAFDRELSRDPLRSGAERLRALVVQREEGVR